MISPAFPTWTSPCGRATIHHGDCLDVMRSMEAGSVDAVVTDPPYEIGGEVVRRGGKSVDALPSWDRFDVAWVEQAARVLREGGSLASFTDCRRVDALIAAAERAGLRLRSTFYWVKANPPPNLRRSFQSAVEVGAWIIKGKSPEWNGGGATPNVHWSPVEPGGDDRHPTQKPVSVMRWLIALLSSHGATVLDPFLGSGTTLVAALQEGCKAIGIEREARYVEIAKARVAHESKQGSLFA